MAISIYNKIKQGGFIMSPYAFIRGLTPVYAVVLAEILAELNYASNHHLNFEDSFLCDLNRMCTILGMEWEEFGQILDYLEKNGFVEFYNSDIEGITYITVYQDNIVRFKDQQDKNDNYINWDMGLWLSCNPVKMILHFSDLVYKIKSYCDGHLKNPDTIPLIIYSYLNDVVRLYERAFGSASDILNKIKNYIDDVNKSQTSSEAIRIGFITIMNNFNIKAHNYIDNMEEDK